MFKSNILVKQSLHTLFSRPVQDLGQNILINANLEGLQYLGEFMSEPLSIMTMSALQYSISSGCFKSFSHLNKYAGYGVSGYLTLGYFRALAVNTAQNSYDPYFVLPIINMGLTYLLIQKDQEQNKLSSWNLAFIFGLCTVGTPINYMIAFQVMASIHLLQRGYLQIMRERQTNKILQQLKLSKRELDQI